MNKKILFYTLLFLFSKIAISQEVPVLTPSKGINNIFLGQSIKRKDLKKIGKYKWGIGFGGVWERTLAFRKEYSFANETLKIGVNKWEIFSKYKVNYIIAEVPYEIITDKGIKLGESTQLDIINAYGQPDEIYNYYLIYDSLAVSFLIESNTASEYYNKVIRIDTWYSPW